VRDLLLSRTPKDFDVSTSATPNEIKQLFRNCRIIGRRFRLAHIFFGQKTIETSTFRANPRHDDDDDDAELLIRRDNVFGTATEDAQRRDFTINGLFYDVSAQRVIDHVGGLEDLDARVIRTIGVPEIRFREDPVRMLRAVKFAARLDFTIEPETYDALVRHRREILKCAPPRVLEELYRMLRGGAARKSLQLLLETGLARVLSAQLALLFSDPETLAPEADEEAPQEPDSKPASEEDDWAATWEDGPAIAPAKPAPPPPSQPPDEDLTRRAAQRELAWSGLDHLDAMARRGDRISNALILAVISCPFVIDDLLRPGMRPMEANAVLLHTLGPLVEQLHVARRDAERTRQVLLAQRRLAPSRRRRGRPMALVRRDYFDEALATYEIGALAAGRDTADVARWRRLKSEGSGEGHRADRSQDSRGKRRRRRRGGRRRRRNRDETRDDEEVGAESRAAASP